MDLIATAPKGQHRGTLIAGPKVFECSLGRSGIVGDKREGDGGTPIGSFPLRRLFWRPDRLIRPTSALPGTALDPTMGWCDAPDHTDYNRLVSLPHDASCETLWRDDSLYDLIVVPGHNDDPPIPNLGSAIFLHLTPKDQGPTQGCVALELPDLLWVVGQIGPRDNLIIRLA